METNYFILSFVIVPFIGFILSLIIPSKREKLISKIAIYTGGIQFILILFFSVYWFFMLSDVVNINEIVLYQSYDYSFFIDFYFDRITAVYLIIGSFTTFLIVRYSRYYMHMENGYKRFFNTILFFYFGYCWTIISGNLETLFIGWEIVGTSSFLLIAFYRDRYLPVRNAVKVFSIYRIGDIGLILATWASHHLWHENITFYELTNSSFVQDAIEGHTIISVFIGICILFAAAAKSAQFPFSSWLPRAMEGPTPSSAIFYGALSVHFGVFLLLRTFPFWEQITFMRVLTGFVGLSTAIVAFFITRVQSNIKTQIAYASITQIGIMFIEVALGLETLALIHFAGNAFLRTYQLLVSPSIVSYLIKEQMYQPKSTTSEKSPGALHKLRNTLYLLSTKEWYLQILIYKLIFKPLKSIGHNLKFISFKSMLLIIPLIVTATILHVVYKGEFLLSYVPETLSIIGFLFVIKAFSEKKSPLLAWCLILLNNLLVSVEFYLHANFDSFENGLYLSGILASGIIGTLCISWLKKREKASCNLQQYNGHVQEYPKLALLFLVAVLGLMGFPITPSFIGFDLILSHIGHDEFVLILFNSMSFVLSGIALVRIYARLFLATHVKNYNSNALLSA